MGIALDLANTNIPPSDIGMYVYVFAFSLQRSQSAYIDNLWGCGCQVMPHPRFVLIISGNLGSFEYLCWLVEISAVSQRIPSSAVDQIVCSRSQHIACK